MNGNIINHNFRGRLTCIILGVMFRQFLQIFQKINIFKIINVNLSF